MARKTAPKAPVDKPLPAAPAAVLVTLRERNGALHVSVPQDTAATVLSATQAVEESLAYYLTEEQQTAVTRFATLSESRQLFISIPETTIGRRSTERLAKCVAHGLLRAVAAPHGQTDGAWDLGDGVVLTTRLDRSIVDRVNRRTTDERLDALANEVLPRTPALYIPRLQQLLDDARASPPQDKKRFVDTFNLMLDVVDARLELPDGRHARLVLAGKNRSAIRYRAPAGLSESFRTVGARVTSGTRHCQT